jgi:hypothetical protein
MSTPSAVPLPVGPIPGKNMVDLIRDVRAGRLKPADLPDGLRHRIMTFAKTLPAEALTVPAKVPIDHHAVQSFGPIRRTRSA